MLGQGGQLHCGTMVATEIQTFVISIQVAGENPGHLNENWTDSVSPRTLHSTPSEA